MAREIMADAEAGGWAGAGIGVKRSYADMILGNLHLNIVAREFKDEIKNTIEPYIYELVGKSLLSLHPPLHITPYFPITHAHVQHPVSQPLHPCADSPSLRLYWYHSDNTIAENSGSISAEHGLGLMKAPYIRYSRDETAIGMMKQIKNLFDPKGLLNPGKYII